jgi:hypothetical protein
MMLLHTSLLLALVSISGRFSNCLNFDAPLQVTFDDHQHVAAQQTPRIAIIGERPSLLR